MAAHNWEAVIEDGWRLQIFRGEPRGSSGACMNTDGERCIQKWASIFLEAFPGGLTWRIVQYLYFYISMLFVTHPFLKLRQGGFPKKLENTVFFDHHWQFVKAGTVAQVSFAVWDTFNCCWAPQSWEHAFFCTPRSREHAFCSFEECPRISSQWSNAASGHGERWWFSRVFWQLEFRRWDKDLRRFSPGQADSCYIL